MKHEVCYSLQHKSAAEGEKKVSPKFLISCVDSKEVWYIMDLGRQCSWSYLCHRCVLHEDTCIILAELFLKTHDQIT